jgi:hypothetical protein
MTGKSMKNLLIATSLLCASSVAFAHGCPGEMKKIDEKMPSVKLSAADQTKVKDLRAKGEQLHKDGKHSESMATLGEAKKILGL